MGSYITLQWDAVGSVGLNGGFIAQSQVYYNIYLAEPVYELGSLKETRLTYIKHVKTTRTDCDIPGMNEGEFENIFFGICAESELGEGPMSYVEFQKGEKYNPPYMESFSNGETSTFIEVRSIGYRPDTGVFLHDESADDDGGAVAFETEEPDASVEMRTAKIWLSATPQPQLRFSTRNVSGANRLVIHALTPDNERHTVATVVPGKEYEHIVLDISEFSSGLWARFFMTAEFDSEAAADGGARIDVDDIKVGNADDIGINIADDMDYFIPEGRNICSPDGLIIRRNSDNIEGLRGIFIIGGRKRLL